MEAIIDVRIGDADANSWKPLTMHKLLEGWEKLKKDNNRKACYNQRRKVYPFVLSLDRTMGKEALVVLANVACHRLS